MSKEEVVEVTLKIKVPDDVRQIAFDRDGTLVLSIEDLRIADGRDGKWKSNNAWCPGGRSDVEVLNWNKTKVKMKSKKTLEEKIEKVVYLLECHGLAGDHDAVARLLQIYERCDCPDDCYFLTSMGENVGRWVWMTIDEKKYCFIWDKLVCIG